MDDVTDEGAVEVLADETDEGAAEVLADETADAKNSCAGNAENLDGSASSVKVVPVRVVPAICIMPVEYDDKVE